MKKQTALRYESIINDTTDYYGWASYDNQKKEWYICAMKRRFYTVNELKKYFNGKI